MKAPPQSPPNQAPGQTPDQAYVITGDPVRRAVRAPTPRPGL